MLFLSMPGGLDGTEQAGELLFALRRIPEPYRMHPERPGCLDIRSKVVDEHRIACAEFITAQQVLEYLRIRLHHLDLPGNNDPAEQRPECVAALQMSKCARRHIRQAVERYPELCQSL